MRPQRVFSRLFDQYGEEVDVYEKADVEHDDFGNTEWDWLYSDTITCIIGYIDQSYEVNEITGEYDVDTPRVYFRRQDAPIDGVRETRIERKEVHETFYELEAATRHRSHIEVTAELCRDEPPVQKFSDRTYREFKSDE